MLKKSSYLFDLKFRITLFKLFIMSKYDYCSSLFIHFSDSGNHERIDKNFAKAIKAYLKINIFNLSIGEQLSVLNSYTLLPLKLRFFKNLVFFVFSLIKHERNSTILNSIKSLRKTRITRAFFDEPISNTNLYKFSFISIFIKLLNIVKWGFGVIK